MISPATVATVAVNVWGMEISRSIDVVASEAVWPDMALRRNFAVFPGLNSAGMSAIMPEEYSSPEGLKGSWITAATSDTSSRRSSMAGTSAFCPASRGMAMRSCPSVAVWPRRVT